MKRGTAVTSDGAQQWSTATTPAVLVMKRPKPALRRRQSRSSTAGLWLGVRGSQVQILSARPCFTWSETRKSF